MTRSKLNRLIKYNGNDEVDVTPMLVFEWWLQLDEALFNYRLPDPDKLLLINHPRYLGWYMFNPCARKYKHTIAINHSEPFTLYQFLSTLGHEMVHMYQSVHHPNDDSIHGRFFWSWEPIFEEAGLLLATTANLETEMV